VFHSRLCLLTDTFAFLDLVLCYLSGFIPSISLTHLRIPPLYAYTDYNKFLLLDQLLVRTSLRQPRGCMWPNDTTPSYWIAIYLLSFLLLLARRNIFPRHCANKSPQIKHASSLYRSSPLYRHHGAHPILSNLTSFHISSFCKRVWRCKIMLETKFGISLLEPWEQLVFGTFSRCFRLPLHRPYS